MSWTLDGIRIFVTDFKETNSNIIATLQPLSGGTIFQKFGHENSGVTVVAFIVGEDDRTALETLARSSSTKYLVNDAGTSGSYYVFGVDSERSPAVYQTMRSDLPIDSPVYVVSIDLKAST